MKNLQHLVVGPHDDDDDQVLELYQPYVLIPLNNMLLTLFLNAAVIKIMHPIKTDPVLP